jgi:hypothetical protein
MSDQCTSSSELEQSEQSEVLMQSEQGETPEQQDATVAEDKRIVITLGVEAAKKTRELADRLGITAPEAVRRGLTLLLMQTDLGPDEEIVIRNKKTRETTRIVFHYF